MQIFTANNYENSNNFKTPTTHPKGAILHLIILRC